MARKKNSEPVICELTIDALGMEGVAIARNAEGIVHFVKHAAPGDRIQAEIRHTRKRYAEAVIKHIIQPSPHRINPACIHAGICGGCTWQHLEYQQQLFWKKQHTADSFSRIGKVTVGRLDDTVPAPVLFHYRNKMEFSFGNSRWLTEQEIQSGDELKRDFALGLHVPGRFDKILDLQECHIQPEAGNELLHLIRQQSLQHKVTAYDPRNHKGFLRSLIIRKTITPGEFMAVLIVSTPNQPEEEQFLDWWKNQAIQHCPFITSLLYAINDSWSPIAQGELFPIHGPAYITETIDGIQYRISPFSFFQTNSYQLPVFLDLIIQQAEIQKHQHIWDLYCGAGTITLPAARQAAHCTGIELSASSIADAMINKELNSIGNADFYCYDLHKPAAIEHLQKLHRPDTIIIDPPRAGVHEILLRHILAIAPERLVYVSCNPATQARDCAILSEKYDIEKVIPVDMFPHTAHIEAIARLKLR
jgi:23S rRNA (uracil1939-C5)-methyltransferase